MISGPLAPVSTRIGSSPPRIRCPQVDARDVMPMLRPRTRKLDSSSMSIRSRTLISSAMCSSFLVAGSSQLAVEVVGGADQREVGERLREVAEQLAGAPDLLGVEAEMVRVGEHLVEDEQCLVQPARAGKRLDVPERANRERALGALDPVRRGLDVVGEHEAVRDELARDR